ncbi:MAG: glycosyltransferase family 4 protein, partial [Anaerolineaceae bacterium]|nr:glycosyltransferase family 4 protein [Anaerolineaceae bacterium]
MNNVTLTGFVDNRQIPAYQAAADVLLMPYERVIEVSGGGNTADFCSPMKMFDYLCAGRAIISSDLPVLREILNTENAILCPAGDIDAWSLALNELIHDAPKCERLASGAKKDAINFTWLDRARRSLEGF